MTCQYEIALPDGPSYDDVPEETIDFKESDPCGFLRTGKRGALIAAYSRLPLSG